MTVISGHRNPPFDLSVSVSYAFADYILMIFCNIAHRAYRKPHQSFVIPVTATGGRQNCISQPVYVRTRSGRIDPMNDAQGEETCA